MHLVYVSFYVVFQIDGWIHKYFIGDAKAMFMFNNKTEIYINM